jgi:hypothetical protein
VDRDGAREWWDEVRQSAPSGLGGLWFGLVELADSGWHIYVAGTSTFEATDETAEWAVGPYAWWPDRRYFPLPEMSLLGVADAVEAAASFVRGLSPWSNLPVDGVATGFDDSEFLIVHRA